MYSVINKRFFTPFQELPTRMIKAIGHFFTSTMIFAFTETPRRFFVNQCAFVEFEEWSITHFTSARKSWEGVKTLVNYGIYHQNVFHYGIHELSHWKLNCCFVVKIDFHTFISVFSTSSLFKLIEQSLTRLKWQIG